MTLQRRLFTSLPPYLQSDRNNLEAAVADDLLYEPEQAAFVSGFIGDTSKLTAEDLRRTPRLLETTALRQKYQFSIGVAQADSVTGNFLSGAFYDDLLNHLSLNGAFTDDPNRLFGCPFYSWSPPIDYDKLVNPARYFWTGTGTADLNGEYVTKEPAGSLTSLHQFDGTTLVRQSVTVVDGLPGSGSADEIVEDVSTTERLFYQWNGTAWTLIEYVIAADATIKSTYFTNDFVYVCRTGPDFNRPLIWVYRPNVGRWIAIPVVVSIDTPDNPIKGMIWEDATIPPARVLRIYDGSQWQLLSYTSDAGPSGTPSIISYLFDTRALDDVDTWSANNWWRALDDLSVSDRSALVERSQGSRPIIEFWGNIESAGDTRTVRNQFPRFILYGVSTIDFVIRVVNTTNFPGLDGFTPATTTIFNYVKLAGGTPDAVLGFNYKFGSDGTPEFFLDLERKTVTIDGDPLLGYRFYRDTATGFVHCIWERSNSRLTQAVDSDGLYEIPKNLKSNPDHIVTSDVSRSSYIDHFAAVMSAQTGFTGTPYGQNNFRYTDRDLTLGALMIDPEESLLRIMAVLQTNRIDIPDAIRQMSREYNRVMVKFVNQLVQFWDDNTISTYTNTLSVTAAQAVDVILTTIFSGRNQEFPFFLSLMGTFLETRMVAGSPVVFDTTAQPIFIPNSAPQIGASPAYAPEIFTDDDGVKKIRGHDGSLIPAFDDPRDDVILEFENRFYDSVPDYMKNETTQFSARFNSAFHLDDFYGNFRPTLTGGTVVQVVNDYTAIGSPITGDRIFSRNQQVYATWDGSQWLTILASVGDIFLNIADNKRYIYNGYFANPIPTWNRLFHFDYAENEFRSVIQREFERWVVLHNLDFITNNDFDVDDPFTWNFSSAGVEGNWRGIYRRLYRTIRPHSHAWEVVGYSIMPDWWLGRYVPTSTASDGTPRYASTHPMWVDFQAGLVNIDELPTVLSTSAGTVDHIVADYTAVVSPTLDERVYSTTQYVFATWDGTQWLTKTELVGSIFLNDETGKYYRYLGAAHALVAPIPVNTLGALLDPIAAGVIGEPLLTVSSLGDDWAYGDGAPIEQNFYNSYYFAFAFALAGYLMKPALFVDRTWSEFYRLIGRGGTNLIWNGPHIVDNATLTRPRASSIPSQLSLDDDGNSVTNPGLNSWIAEYTAIIGLSPDQDFNKAVVNAQAALGWKTSGFINAKRTRIDLLNGDEIPVDDLSFVLHQGPSINEYFQSGIIIIRDTDGFRVFGTDVLDPFFRVELGAQPTAGGRVENVESFYYGNFLKSATIVASGGAYQVNDIVTLDGGISTTAATLKITAVDGDGAVTAFAINDVGSYSITPDSPVQTTGGSGTAFKVSAIWDLTTRTFTTSTLSIPPITNDTATFGVLVNGFKVQDKYIKRLGTTSFSIDPVLMLNKGDKITASVVTTMSNPSTQIGSFTVNGVQVTYFQSGTGVFVNYAYGTLFRTLSDVVNMMVGHGRYLMQQGWIFERLTNGVLRDWLGAAKTFALWATNLSNENRRDPKKMKGAQFEFSVMGRQAQFTAPFGMILGVEDIRNGSYGVVDVRGDPIRGNHLNVVSTNGEMMVSSDDTDIFGLRLYLSEVQHAVFFPNTTTFNDIIYEPALGLSQDAVLVDTYRTTNWNGRMEAPGFLISGGNLLPNWEKQANDITRYYDRFNPPDDPILTAMARNLFGYAPKAYMNPIQAEDRSRFNFFRGSLKVKGTFQPYRAFIRGTTIGSDNVNISEDWAWKFAKYGDRRIITVLFNVDEPDFVDIFQAIHFNTKEDTIYQDDRIIYVPPFAPPAADDRWVLTPPEDLYKGIPYKFPAIPDSRGRPTRKVDYNKYTFSAVLVDQNAKAPGVNLFDWHPAQDLHEPFALGLVDYKTAYDPAYYNQGPLTGGPDGLIWNNIQVGTVWWDTSTALYSDYETFLPDYMRTTREWGKLKYFNASIVRVDDVVKVTTLNTHTGAEAAHGLSVGDKVVISGADQKDYNGTFTLEVVPTTSSFTFTAFKQTDTPGTGDIMVQIGKVDCYEWVASPVPPATWDTYITTQTGFDIYTGVVRNADDPSYSTREIWDVNGNSKTTYYFWVQANTRVIPSKELSVFDIAGRLKNPALYEIPYFGLLDTTTMFVFIGEETVSDGYGIEVSYEWYEMPRHVEWMLFGESDDFAEIPALVSDKLIDSMLGTDIHGNAVPNTKLAPIDRYGSSFFPQQTVFHDIPKAIESFTLAVNEILSGIELQFVSDLFSGLSLSDELTDLNPDGYWSRTTFWDATVDHTVLYDTVLTIAERDFRTTSGLYAADDIIKVIESDQEDIWDHTQVAAYYQYDGSAWNLVGVINHTVSINSNIASHARILRDFYKHLVTTVTRLQANRVIFAVLFEMLRQNPTCDWLFKTSYIDPHITEPLPTYNYVRPDQATAVVSAILDLKPFRTKLRDTILTYIVPTENVPVVIQETQIDRTTLIFDRVACDLTDENSWDTIAWDATVTSPENTTITLMFRGDGIQKCFLLPEAVPAEQLVVLLNNQLVAPGIDYLFNQVNFELCFAVPPPATSAIEVIIDGPYEYIAGFEYSFRGDSSKSTEIVPDALTGTTPNNVFTTWNGVHQRPVDDFIIQVTSDTEVSYLTTPTSEIEVNGIVFGGVINDIFVASAYTGNGTTRRFSTTLIDETQNSVVVCVDGVWQTHATAFTIDNITDPLHSLVEFDVAPPNGAHIVIYAATYPHLIDSKVFDFIGDGVTAFFAVPDLLAATLPKIFVNLDGIQQNLDTFDYFVTPTGILFTIPPGASVSIDIFVIWDGVGLRLTPVSSPSTIQWDWAFWNYADLGRKEYDLAAVFVGDDVTEDFTLPIPQTTSLLYNVLIKLFQNGIATTTTALGLTMTTINLSTGVVVSFDTALPSGVYGALYISRGFFEGLEPTFGYQDPNGVVFLPTAASYEHYFARLISATYDPSTQMVGCPAPEERMETAVDDLFTIVVKTFTETFDDLRNLLLVGQQVAAQVGTFAFDITTNPTLVGVVATTQTGSFIVTYDAPPTNLSGVQATTQLGFFTFSLGMSGVQAVSAIGSFTFDITSQDAPSGLQATAQLATIHPTVLVTGADAATAQIGVFVTQNTVRLTGLAAMAFLGTLTVELDHNQIMSGQAATAAVGATNPIVTDALAGVAAASQTGQFALTIFSTANLIGLSVTSQVGAFSVFTSRGESAFAEIADFITTVTPSTPGLESTSEFGELVPDPNWVGQIGVEATASVGTMGVSIGG